MDVKESIFDFYESQQKSPICLDWIDPSKDESKGSEKCIHKGMLITIKGRDETPNIMIYGLTMRSLLLFTNEDGTESDKPVLILPLRNPHIIKIIYGEL